MSGERGPVERPARPEPPETSPADAPSAAASESQAGAASAGAAPATTSPAGAASPIGVYIHFPFCRTRCHYCAFYFVVGRADARAGLVDAVVAEIARRAEDPRFAGRRAHSVYFGGGTPSLLEASDVARIVRAADAAFPLVAGAEISLESNPESAEAAKLRELRAAGVNRLTLGWQSLRDANLRLLTRTHSAVENLRAYEAARAAGLQNVAVDLMFGVPGQTLADWRGELSEVAAAGPEHVSAYELTFEEGTRLAARRTAGRFTPPGEDARADLFEATDDALAAAGIERYEISNFARPGFECKHNLAGWRGGDLAGFGPSAASHVRESRWTNVADLDEYVRRVRGREETAQDPEIAGEATWAAEDLYLGLRTMEGIDSTARLEWVGAGVRSRLEGVLASAVANGLLEREGGRLRLTRRGLLFADTVFEGLLSCEMPG